MLLTMSEEGMARISTNTECVCPRAGGLRCLRRRRYLHCHLRASLAAGLDGDTALRLANVAAGIVVGKVGTVPVSQDELLVEMLAESERQAARKSAARIRCCGGFPVARPQ